MAGRDKVRPQDGFQLKFLSSPADIAIGGGAAGAGKTFSLLLEFLRHIRDPGWGGVIFRRTSPQIRSEGGLWDTSMNIYPFVGASPKESLLEWNFGTGPKLKFSHLEHEKNVLDWQGSQIPFIGFDELTHFSERMFWYLLSRNRSMCGVKPYVRATCNPDPESWVYRLIEWWIDPETGFPIPERDGVLRYLIRDGENYIWGDTEEEVIEKAKHFLEPVIERSGVAAKEFVKSVTFVSGSVYDNKELLSVNPAYLANLLSQDEQTRKQLMDGNWKVVLSDIDIYDYYSFAGLFENRYQVNAEGRFITADIALKGSNKFVVGVWYGRLLQDLLIMDKSKGNEVIEGIERMAKLHKVQNRHIAYDNDGVGGFVDGFIKGSVPFVNGAAALNGDNYQHLKAQCFYRSGDNVGAGEMKINPIVANMMYDDKMTVRQRFMYERKAIKRDKTDSDGKLSIIKKEQMKVILNGDSPDLMDMLMMREYFDLKPKREWL